ncbi:chromodomain-helicase-DNA-binding protein 8-like protein, partial [Leptotrombidium deliense]
VELTNIQKKYYRAILERNFQFLTKGGTYANMPNLMNTMMELRKCCIHPFLINGAEEQVMHEYKQQHSESNETQLQAMIQASGKLVLIDKLLPRLRTDGHRVLVFSQMVRCLDILEDYLVQKRYPYERIDGRVRGNLRQAAIDRFCKPDSDRFVFLLCTRAGGLGINLTAADTVIIFDSDWNPQNDLQAQARCHRIGQSKMVKVYRLICRNTYEREMFDKASLKLGLDKAVLQSMNTQKSIADNAMSKKEVEDLLRKGAYGAIMDDDNAGDKFCEEDIEQILQRRTRVITIESEEQGSTFSKASFAASDNRSDIEIDDPNFWEKWARKAHLDVDELKGRNELIVQEPRKRTQTKRFGQDDSMLDISDVESSDDDDDVAMRTRGSRGRLKGKKGRKGRGGGYEREKDEDYLEEFGPGNWTRAECYKVEKGLLTFGWARWDEFLILGNFRRRLSRQDVEDIARVILLFCLQNYKGDEKIKSFIWDLISPAEHGGQKFHKNHSGLSAPVPRGRKNKKVKRSISEEVISADWARDESYNPDFLLTDEQYRKHLHRHANKILLRVRLLFYLKHEIIGDLYDQVFAGLPARDITIPSPVADGDPPCNWWDEECDKSLLIGVYKHGYDRYNLMRHDPALCFLHRCGPPDGAALLAEMNPDDDLGKTLEEDEEPETPVTPATPSESSRSDGIKEDVDATDNSGPLPFPSTADMNQRLRRIITAYQRNFKKQELRLAQQARHQQRLEKLERFEAAIKERELKKREQAQKKWSRREEADFYRAVSSFGVEYNKKEDRFDWSRFRTFSKLERKLDDTLTEYFKAFYSMCKRVTGRRITEEEENLPISVDPISEERASRSLARIDLLSKIREDILVHPDLDERLQLCQPSIDLPEWWVCGLHDKDLLIGAAKYGLNRLDFHLMHDVDLSFKDVLKSEEIDIKKDDSNQKLNDETEIDQHKAILCDSEMKSVEEKHDQPLVNDISTNEQSFDKTVSDSSEIKQYVKEEEKSDNLEVQNEADNDKPELKENTNTEKSVISTSELVGSNDDTKSMEEIKLEKATDHETLEQQVEEENENKVDINDEKTNELQKNMSEEFALNPADANEDDISKEIMEVKDVIEECKAKAEAEIEPNLCVDEKITAENVEKCFEQETQLELKNEVNSDDFRNSLNTQPKSNFRWPKDRVLQIRLEQICYCVEKNEWHSFRQAFFSNIAGTLPSTPSIATADSSPRAASPGSLSSVSREPTPHPTPDHTPRRESLSPLPEYLFSESGCSVVYIRNELLSDEKTASLLLGTSLSQTQPKSTNSSNAPPPAHQNSSTRRSNPMENIDFRFKTTPAIVPPPSPAHKPSPTPRSEKKPNKSPSSPVSVLDLSSGQSTKREGSSLDANSNNSNKSISGIKKMGKKIGSRIDALALNLQAKKMMEEKQSDKNESNILFDNKSSDRKDILNKLDVSKYSSQNKLNFPTPPAAHSSSASSFSKTNDSFSKNTAHLSSLDASKLPPSKVNEASSILEQAAAIRQDLKKWLEDHPEFVAANPNLAAAAAAAMSFTPISSIPANTELLELPEGRRRGRRPKLDPTMLDVQHLTGDENVSVITGSKAPPLKHLAEWLEKNPMFDIDPKWSPLIKEKVPSFKTPTSSSSSSIRTRTSDRRVNDLNSTTSIGLNSNSSRRTTAASLLAQSQSGAHANQAVSTSGSTSSSNTTSFGFQPSALNPLGFNPSLLTGFPSMKMFMDSANLCTTTSSTTSASTSKSHSSSAATTSTATSSALSSSSSSSSAPPMFFPFGGLAGMGLGNPLFGFPGFNLPGLTPGANPLSDFPNKKEKAMNSTSTEKSKSNEKSSINSSGKSKSNNNPGNMFGPSGTTGLSTGGLPFLYPTPNFLYSPLSLGGFSLPSSPFATLAAQTGLMNGLGNLGTTAMSGFTTTTTTSSASHSKSKSSHSAHKSSSTTKNVTSNSSTNAVASGLSLSTSGAVLSSGAHSKSTALTESDDDSLKSLMGHEDDDENEINGDLGEQSTKNDTDSDYEQQVSKKKKSLKDLNKSRKCNSTAATSKITS